jgi:hypothetical protein
MLEKYTQKERMKRSRRWVATYSTSWSSPHFGMCEISSLQYSRKGRKHMYACSTWFPQWSSVSRANEAGQLYACIHRKPNQNKWAVPGTNILKRNGGRSRARAREQSPLFPTHQPWFLFTAYRGSQLALRSGRWRLGRPISTAVCFLFRFLPMFFLGFWWFFMSVFSGFACQIVLNFFEEIEHFRIWTFFEFEHFLFWTIFFEEVSISTFIVFHFFPKIEHF